MFRASFVCDAHRRFVAPAAAQTRSLCLRRSPWRRLEWRCKISTPSGSLGYGKHTNHTRCARAPQQHLTTPFHAGSLQDFDGPNCRPRARLVLVPAPYGEGGCLAPAVRVTAARVITWVSASRTIGCCFTTMAMACRALLATASCGCSTQCVAVCHAVPSWVPPRGGPPALMLVTCMLWVCCVCSTTHSTCLCLCTTCSSGARPRQCSCWTARRRASCCHTSPPWTATPAMPRYALALAVVQAGRCCAHRGVSGVAPCVATVAGAAWSA